MTFYLLSLNSRCNYRLEGAASVPQENVRKFLSIQCKVVTSTLRLRLKPVPSMSFRRSTTINISTEHSEILLHRQFLFCFVFFEFGFFRSIRTIAGPGWVVGTLPRPKQRWANQRTPVQSSQKGRECTYIVSATMRRDRSAPKQTVAHRPAS